MYNFNLGFHAVGLALMLMLLSMSSWRKSFMSLSYKAYLILYWESFLSIIIDIMSIVTTNLVGIIPRWVNILTCRFYLISLVVVASSIFRYVNLQAHPDGFSKDYHLYVSAIPVLAASLGIFMTSTYAFYDEKCVYILGNSTEVCSLFALCYLVGALLVAVMSWSKIPSKKRRAILFATIGTILIALVQYIDHGLELTSLYLAMSMVYTFHGLENPADYVDTNSTAYNRAAFDIFVHERYQEKRQFSTIIIHFYNMRHLRTYFGSGQYGFFLRTIVDYLRQFKSALVFHTDEHEVTITFFDQGGFDKARTEIKRKFESDWEFGDSSVNITISMVIYPSTMKSVSPSEARNSYLYFRDEMLRAKEGSVIYVDSKEIAEKKRAEEIHEVFKKALLHDTISSYYHFIYNKETMDIERAEALLRIEDEDGNYIENAELMPLAERSGLLMDIAERHFDKVCRMIADVHPWNYGLKKICVNLSPYQCMQKNLTDVIIQIMERYGISPTTLCFEVSSDSLAVGGAVARTNIARLTAAGCDVVLDKYGQDNLDLRTFVDLPINGVKLDARMVLTCLSNSYMKNAVALVGHIAAELRKTVTIYGIEKETSLTELSGMQYNLVQGNLFSQAMPEDSFINKLRERGRV